MEETKLHLLKNCEDVLVEAKLIGADKYGTRIEIFGKDNSYRLWIDENKIRPTDSKTYEDGIKEAWDIAKKVVSIPKNGGFTNEEIKDIFGTQYRSEVFKKYTATEASKKFSEWEKKTKFSLNDQVINMDGMRGVIMNIVSPNETFFIWWEDGTSGEESVGNIKRTGLKINVAELLEQIGVGDCGED